MIPAEQLNLQENPVQAGEEPQVFGTPTPSELRAPGTAIDDMGEFEAEFVADPAASREEALARAAARRARRLEAAAHVVVGSTRRNSNLGGWSRDIESLQLIDETREKELYSRIIAGKDTDADTGLVQRAADAKQELLEANVRLVIAAARRRVIPKDIEFMDVVAEGNMALVRAIEAFGPTYGVKLSTYATRAIDRAITTFVRTKHRPVYISESDQRLLWEHQRQAMEARKRGEPEPPESSEVGMLRQSQEVVSLDKEVGLQGGGSATRLGDIQADPKAHEFANSTVQFDRERFAGYIASLLTDGITLSHPLRQAETRAAIAIDALGLGDSGRPLSTKELTDKYRTSPARINRAVSAVQAVLREHEEEVLSFLV